MAVALISNERRVSLVILLLPLEMQLAKSTTGATTYYLMELFNRKRTIKAKD